MAGLKIALDDVVSLVINKTAIACLLIIGFVAVIYSSLYMLTSGWDSIELSRGREFHLCTARRAFFVTG